MPDPVKVLMICGHEPMLDPRIRWEAEAAASRFDITVLGFNRPDGSCPEHETVDGYRLIRLKPPAVGAGHYLWRLKDIVPRRARLPALLVLALLFPLLVLAEILFRLIRIPVRRLRRGARAGLDSARRLVTVSLLLRAIRLRERRDRLRLRTLSRVDYVRAVLRQFATTTSAFWNHVRDTPVKPDVVHCNDLETLLVGILAKQQFGCRLVYDAHEFYPRSDPDGGWIDVAFFSLLERLLIRRADAVVTVNPMLAEVMRRAYGLQRVYAVANAELWVEGRPEPAHGSEMDRLAAGRVKFLFQGRFTPGRGIDELIEGWTAVDGRRAALFLRGPANIWRERAMAQAAALGLLDHSVYFLDAVSEEALVPAAAEADVGIIPYRPLIINDRLSCPNKLSQYLHAGLMVIANDLPYVKSVLTEAEAGLFYNSSTSGTLAAAVRTILGDPELLQRARRNARRYARERFNWQVEGETLYALYRRPERSPELPAAHAESAPQPSM
ncbi:MAG: glycosyltransferase [Alphaproteobacteria bacterium]|nr:glycosyltransferase [Alphaproteobacteria bacterium]